MDKALIERKDVYGDGNISRTALENILNEKIEPRPTNKQRIVEWLRLRKPELSNILTVELLESSSFDCQALFSRTSTVALQEFDVDALTNTVQQIVSTATGKPNLISRLLGIPINRATEQFWGRIRALLRSLSITNEEFNKALAKGGVPPKLLALGNNPLACAREIRANVKSLTREQQIIWKVVQAVYPPSSQEECIDLDLKKPARYLAYYWDLCIREVRYGWQISIEDDLARQRTDDTMTLILLTWLELSLVLKTEAIGAGKLGLFALANRQYELSRQAIV